MTADILLIDNDDMVLNSVQPVCKPDLVILGIDPPGQGWRFCHQLLAFLESPLLLLLSTCDEKDHIKGLSLGADACMAKPVLLGELVARVQALTRQRKDLFVDGDLVVDLNRQEIRLDSESLALTPTEFRVLSCLIQDVGEVVSYQRLLAQVWGPDRRDSRHLLNSCIYHLRQKLEPDPRHPRRIVTRLREGYALHRIEE